MFVNVKTNEQQAKKCSSSWLKERGELKGTGSSRLGDWEARAVPLQASSSLLIHECVCPELRLQLLQRPPSLVDNIVNMVPK